MKKSLIILSLSTTLMLGLHIGKTAKVPMAPKYLSEDNGGVLSAIDAYKDGVGILVTNSFGTNYVDNSSLNKLVYKYGEEAKRLNLTLKDTLLLKKAEGDNSVIEDLDNLNANPIKSYGFVDGTLCDDGNAQTINDQYKNNICIGTNVEGQMCDDGISATMNDKYTNGVCIGINMDGQACTDGNPQTINDKYNNGSCIGTNVEGQACNDGDSNTVVDKYHNGVCKGIPKISRWPSSGFSYSTLSVAKSTCASYGLSINANGSSSSYNHKYWSNYQGKWIYSYGWNWLGSAGKTFYNTCNFGYSSGCYQTGSNYSSTAKYYYFCS